MKMQIKAVWAVALLLCAGVASGATLKITDGNGNWVRIAQNGVLEYAPVNAFGTADYNTKGQVTFTGTIGIWELTGLTIGLTKPVQGSASTPVVTLSAQYLESRGAGNLYFCWSDNDFGPTGGNALATLTGTIVDQGTGSSISYLTYADPGNALLNKTQLLTEQSFSAGTFSDQVTGPDLGDLGNPYSLTQVIKLVHSSTANPSSFTATLTVAAVPDGGLTIALLGCVLVGVEGLRRKFSR